MTQAAPAPIDAGHDCSTFASGTPSLDDWLKRRALANHLGGASRCYVSCEGDRVIGYFALAASSIAIAEAKGRFPDPVPMIIIARLAIDQKWQGKGLGRTLFRDAALRVLSAADIVGVRGMIVHAISEEARDFYLRLGMVESPLSSMTLMATCTDIRAACQS